MFESIKRPILVLKYYNGYKDGMKILIKSTHFEENVMGNEIDAENELVMVDNNGSWVILS